MEGMKLQPYDTSVDNSLNDVGSLILNKRVMDEYTKNEGGKNSCLVAETGTGSENPVWNY